MHSQLMQLAQEHARDLRSPARPAQSGQRLGLASWIRGLARPATLPGPCALDTWGVPADAWSLRR
jgi:hypothetical protein